MEISWAPEAMDGFEGRCAVRSWLYRIATNVCLDMLRGRQRRALAMDLGPAGTADSFLGVTRAEHAWVTPIPDGRVVPDDGDPAAVAEAKESIRLAFVTAPSARAWVGTTRGRTRTGRRNHRPKREPMVALPGGGLGQ